MASKVSEASVRIPVALIVVVLAVATLFLTWVPEIELWFRISETLMSATLLLWAAMILAGKTKSGRPLLTRRRWKFFTVLSTVIAAGITLAVIFIIAVRPYRYYPLVTPLSTMFLGLFVAYSYSWEGQPLFAALDLSKRDVTAWKRTAIVLAIIGISLECVVLIAAAAGNLYALVLFQPIAIALLITVAVLWAMLRTRNRHRSNP